MNEEPQNDARNVDPVPENLVEVGEYQSFHRASEHGLVVLSMNLPYWMFRRGNAFCLYVDKDRASDVQEQIACYEEENRRWKTSISFFPSPRDASWIPIATFGFVIVFLFSAQQRLPEWFLQHGALDAVRVVARGEWWRTITALTLHVHIGHLVANLVAGGLFGWLAMRSFGSNFSVFLILLSGAIGNTMTALFYFPQNHFSVGASTMVFGAVGLVTGKAIIELRLHPHYHSARLRFLPLIVGFIVLGLYGAGGDNVDTAAHLFGFIAGVALGFPAHWFQRSVIRDSPWQSFFLVGASFLFCAAWFRALKVGSEIIIR